jgi:acyl-CoA synthetase (AMP-forming)/AMP-acid ligase II
MLESYGAHPAVIADDGARLSYAGLARAADDFADRLGLARRLVLLETRNDAATLAAYLGCLRGGHAVILASEGASTRDPRILATYVPNAIRTGDGELRLTNLAHDLHPDLAVLLSTSGSTGATKLVRLSGRALDANARSIAEYLTITPNDRALTTLPLHYSYGLSVVNSHLASGATLLLTGRSVIEPELWDFADAHAPTSLAGVPYTYELLDRISFATAAPSSLRTLTQAGGRLPPEAVMRWGKWAAARGARFFVMYGQTEATARMAFLPPASMAAHPDCIGVAIPGGSFTLRDDAGAVVTSAEAPGELIYRGPNVMMGYAETAADLARGSELDELATGDLAVRNVAGLYRIVGRKSRFAKPFGLRISLDEVEAAVRRHGWRGVATGDDSLIAVEVLGNAEPAAVAAALAADFKLAASLFHVTSVADHPLLPSGKIDYRTVLANARLARAAVTSGDPVGDAFALAFGARSLGSDDSFASLGGDSLSYVTVSLALEDALGELPQGWEAMPIVDLRAHGAPQRRGGWLRRMDTDIILRALAILAVVANHASAFVVGGGAHVLLVLVGYNLARFQRVRLQRGEVAPMVTAFATRIILPYYAILLLYLGWKQELNIPALLLAGNIVGEFGSFIEPYWFLEVMLQCYLAVAALFLIPAVRKASSRDPWRFGLWILGGAFYMRLVAARLLDHDGLAGRTPDVLLVFVAIGWCIAFADRTVRRWGVFAAICLVSALTGGLGGELIDWSTLPWPSSLGHGVWLVLATALLLWVPRLSIPTVLHPAIATIAAASFYIYLTHGVPVHVLRSEYDLGMLAVALLSSALLGIATWWASQRLAASRAS